MTVRSIKFSPDSDVLATASDDSYINLYDVLGGQLAASLSGHSSWVMSVDFSPNRKHLASWYVVE